MRKNALVISTLILTILIGITISNISCSTGKDTIAAEQEKTSMAEAKKTALAKINGEVEDEYALEDEDGEAKSYVFVIKTQDNETYEIKVDANSNVVLSAEKQELEDEEVSDEVNEVNPDTNEDKNSQSSDEDNSLETDDSEVK